MVVIAVIVFATVSVRRRRRLRKQYSHRKWYILGNSKKSHILIMGAFLCHCFAAVYNMHVLRMSDFSYISIVFLYF